jgi:hypothetical protein
VDLEREALLVGEEVGVGVGGLAENHLASTYPSKYASLHLQLGGHHLESQVVLTMSVI